MSKPAQTRNPRHLKSLAWLVVLASVSLACTLATRDIRQFSTSGSMAVVSADSVAVPWQKLETDATLWVPPVTLANVLRASDFHPTLPDNPAPSDALLDDSLHNRPPPSC